MTIYYGEPGSPIPKEGACTSNILLPTDGLSTCVYGVCHGVQLAKALGAKVTAVCVTRHLSLQEILRTYHPAMDWRIADSDKADDFVELAQETHKELAQKALEVAERMCASVGVPCEMAVPRERIPRGRPAAGGGETPLRSHLPVDARQAGDHRRRCSGPWRRRSWGVRRSPSWCTTAGGRPDRSVSAPPPSRRSFTPARDRASWWP